MSTAPVLHRYRDGDALAEALAVGVAAVLAGAIATRGTATLAVSGGSGPSWWALSLVLLLPGAWVLRRVLGAVGHDELLPLLGVVLALVPGYAKLEERKRLDWDTRIVGLAHGARRFPARAARRAAHAARAPPRSAGGRAGLAVGGARPAGADRG